MTSSYSQKSQIDEAKEQFETNATDLREIDFGLSLGRKATKSNSKSVITIDWKKAFVVSDAKFTIFEVPLGGDIKKYATTRYSKDGLLYRPEKKKITTNLILKKNNETGEYLYFIATMVGENEDKNVKEIHYTNNCSFTGHIFISNLEGLWVALYKCSSGVRQSLNMNLRKTKSASEKPLEGVTSIQMFRTPTGAYTAGECERDPKCEECLYGGAICSVCYYCHIDIGDVGVTPDNCRKCHGPYGNCYCCWLCKEYPCQCFPTHGCSNCGSIYCTGGCLSTCYYCGSRTCMGNCQSGGGSTGGGDSGGTTNPPTNPSTNKKTQTALKNAAKAAVEKFMGDEHKDEDGDYLARCNLGVQEAFKTIYGTNPFAGLKANGMIDKMANSSEWQQVTLSETQQLANDGWFVVVGYKATSGSGHVAVIVPGTETYSSNYGCKVPNTMDTGSSMRSESQKLSQSFG